VSVAPQPTTTPTRTFDLLVSGPSANAVVADTTGVATLRSTGVAAPAPSLFITDRSVVRATSGSTNVAFTVTLDAAAASNVTVHYSTTDGTATVAAGDYTATSGTLTFTPGQVSKTVSAPTFPTSRRALFHTFTLGLSAPAGAVLGDASGTARLINRSGPYALSVGDTTVVRSGSSPNTAVVTLSLSAPVAAGDTVTVRVRTTDGTAIAGTDYTAVPLTTITFTVGQQTATVSIPVDAAPSGTPVRAFTLTLASPSADALIADAAATINLIGP
jgi:chitinase